MAHRIKIIQFLSVKDFYEKHKEPLHLELQESDAGFSKRISEPAVNRPGLPLAGFTEDFAYLRVQLLGNPEINYLNSLTLEEKKKRISLLCKLAPPCFITSYGNELDPELIDLINSYSICVFKTDLSSLEVANLCTFLLDQEFAATTSIHGCMIQYRGVGILIKGKSGAGKSEAAIGLVERGGALIADDKVTIRNVRGSLTAYTEDFARGFIEMRGIGIINVSNLYGLGSILPESTLDLVVNLRPYSDLNEVDRLGVERKTETILGVPTNYVDIPVAPGRDTARLISVTALDVQLRKLGFNMADEFNERLLAKLQSDI